MRQAPFVFSRSAFVGAVTILLTLVGLGIASTLMTARGSGEWQVVVGPGVQVPVKAPPRAILGLYQTLINRDNTTTEDRRRDLKTLTTYGWVDRAHGLVHIPIERAMELVAKDGL
jgi:hypothetical protein